jgi:drug/metabolite transporter (DMT)-like permease
LGEAGLPGLWMSLGMFTAAALLGTLLTGPRWRELLQQPGLLLLMALANGWLNTAFVLAMLDGNVVRVLLLFYLSPLWSTLLAWGWLGERPSPAGIATLVLAMVGAAFMLWDPSLGLPWPQSAADWLALSAGLGFSLSNVTVRRLHALSPMVMGTAIWWGVVVVAGLWLLLGGHPLPQVAAMTWLGSAALGLLGVFTATLALIYGVGRMPVYRSATILLFELVVGAVSAQWLTDEVVTPREWLGGGLIMLAAYLSARSARRAG